MSGKDLSAPTRTTQQRFAALSIANEVRSYRSHLKRELKAGRVNILELLTNPPEQIDTMKIFDLMMHVPKFGRVKVNKVMSQCRVSPSKTIGGITDRQREELMYFLRRHL